MSTLRELGWRDCFDSQLSPSEKQDLTVARVGAHHGSHIFCMEEHGSFSVPTSLIEPCGPLAVGDWILLEPLDHRGVRRLDRESLIERKAAGEKAESQSIAANVDTLFIISSCNHDFNLSRLERYLSLASESRVTPVVVLTKPDLCERPESYQELASELMNQLTVVTIDARETEHTNSLAMWCSIGQTVALVGSSGVGKSTLATSLGAGELKTQAIREDDSKGRHTTTARSIHFLDAGGLMIDTPGMRELQLADCKEGVTVVFDEIANLSSSCRFRDCTHAGEPGCAVQSAIEAGELEPRRLKNFRKLQSEQERNAMSIREQRDRSRKQGQFYKSVIASKKRSRGRQG